MRRFRQSIVGIVSLGLFLGLGGYTHADNLYGNGIYGSCTFGSCGITVASNGTVSLDVTPTQSGSCTVASDTVGVTTDNSNGYTLTISTSTSSNSMVNGGSSITAVSGSQASPASLTNNSWGYRVDGLGGFGSGPTSAQSNGTTPSYSFAAVPNSSQTADTLASTSVPADPTVNTTVWYGSCVNQTIPSGTYTAQVVYTATTN